MELFIGLDVGTSTVKGVLVSAAGEKLARGSRPVHLLRPQPHWAEIEPEEHVQSVFDLIRELAGRAPAGARVLGLSMAFASGNALFLDRGNRPLSNIFSWLDARTVGKTLELLPELDEDGFHALVGWGHSELFPLAHIAWFRREQPEAWGRLGRVCMNNDYLGFRLTGRWGMDHSTATTFYLQDQRSRRWHRPYLSMLGIDESQLSALHPSGAVLGPLTTQAAAATGLSPDTRVVLGAFDHPCAARGTGIFREGEMLLSCGTSWVCFFPLGDRALGVRLNLLVDPFLTPEGPWGAMAALTAVGVTIDKYIDTAVLRPGEQARKYEVFNAAAGALPAGAGGLFVDVYPSRQGFLQAVPAAPANGSREQLARALMEGAAFEMRREIDRLAGAGIRFERIAMVGGPTESPLWPRIVAEITGLELTLINGQTAGAVGAAILAAVGCEVFRDVREAFAAMGGEGVRIRPEASAVQLCGRLYEQYRARFGK